MRAKPQTISGAVERLELVELAAVHDTGDDLAHVVGLAHVDRHDAVELPRVVGGLGRLAQGEAGGLRPVEVGDDAPGDGEGVGVVLGIVVGHARSAGMDVGPAQLLRAHHLPRRRLHQRRAAEENGALVADDHGLVRHGRHVGPARRAGAHDDGDLGDARGRHGGLVVEDAAEMVLVREDAGPVGQVGPARIDEVDAGQVVLARHVLGAQVLLDRERIVGAALDGGVVGDDDAFLARDAPHARDDASRRHLALVHAVGGELAELEERRARIEEGAHPVAGKKLAARQVPLARALGPAQLGHRHGRAQIGDESAHGGRVLLERRGAGGDGGLDDAHRSVPSGLGALL